MNEKILCIYHGNCADGFGSAWVVRKALGDNVEFVAGFYGQDPPDVTGRTVLLVDFSYKRPVLEKMAVRAKSILILDHHKSAAEDLADVQRAPYEYGCAWIPEEGTWAVFDMQRSGAGITWDYFIGGERPPMISHIEDRDLWKFKIPGTREIQAHIFSYPYDFEVWDILEGKIEASWSHFVGGGAAIERKHHKDIEELVKVSKHYRIIGGFRVPVANLPYTLTSDAGHLMAEDADFAACYFDGPDGRTYSLRSRDGGADVSRIAAEYGGGGHKHAAGFLVPWGHELTMYPIPRDAG